METKMEVEKATKVLKAHLIPTIQIMKMKMEMEINTKNNKQRLKKHFSLMMMKPILKICLQDHHQQLQVKNKKEQHQVRRRKKISAI